MSAQDLSRMGEAKVEFFSDEGGNRVIEKCPVCQVEYDFYQNAANRLNEVEVTSPTLFFADPSLCKLRLEYIPNKINQGAIAENDVLSFLARLHCYPPDPSWTYHNHQWSDAALEKTLILLALPYRAEQQMRCFQMHSDALFSSQYLISGDSNAGNWGKRDNGNLVLFDWERFGTGSPAIDLAPLLKGMGTVQSFTDLAECYNRISCRHDNGLARKIAIAKAWIVTEVIMLLNERKKSNFQFYLNWYKENLPVWLDSTEKIL